MSKFSIVPNPENNRNNNFFMGSEIQHQKILNAEEAIICTIILDNKTIPMISNVIKPENFFSKQNKTLYKSCLFVYEKYKKINYKQLISYLQDDKQLDFVGGEDKICAILSKASYFTDIEFYVNLLLDRSIRKNLEIEGEAIAKKARESFDIAPWDLICDAEKNLNKIKNSSPRIISDDLESSSWQQLSMNFAVDIADNWSTGQSSGFSCGIPDLDYAVGAFMPGDFIMLAGPSGIGKTALGCSLMHTFVKQNIPTLFLSGEMPANQIAARVLSCHTGINSRYLTRDFKKLTQAQIELLFKVSNDTSHYPMSIASCGAGINSIISTIEKSKKEAIDSAMPNFEGEYKVIFLDYLQLLAGGDDKNDNRSLEIDRLAQWCKAYAIENNCVIIAFAQISDEVLQRGGNKIPNINDVGWCKTAKNHVDYLAFLWSDYYNSIGTKNQINAVPDQEILQLWFRKARHTGFSGVVETVITRSICRVDRK